MLSKALVVGAYQRKLEEMAREPDLDLVAVVPPSWRDRSYETRLERAHTDGYELVVSPISVNGSFHLFFFPHIGRLLDAHRPDILHVDEEPYNLATFHAAREARRRRIPFVFFTWQNLYCRYPLPFRWMQSYVQSGAAGAIAGTEAAGAILRRKGYAGPLTVIPQFGVDPEVYKPRPPLPLGEGGGEGGQAERGDGTFTVGYAGRLVREKGVGLLLEACAQLSHDWRLEILGDGPEFSPLQRRARELRVADRVQFMGVVPSSEMPHRLRALDALVLPSVSLPNWVEQFGRVLIEAMATGVPVVGSTCGEIPGVIGDGGLTFPEGDSAALAAVLQRLAADPPLRSELAERGRRRVLQLYTQRRIAHANVSFYREVLQSARP
jgi:glycosyltransferase involved in cell wall biosynthesis